MRFSILSKLPIRSKLLLLTLFAAVFGTFVLAASVIWFEDTTYRQENLQQIKVIANIVAERSTAALVFGDDSQLKDNIESLKLRSSVSLACIYDENDQERVGFALLEGLNCPQSPAINEGIYTGQFLYLTQNIILDGEKIGKLHIQSSLEELRSHLQNYVVTAFFASLLAILAAVFISNILQKKISDPLIHLKETTTRITEEKNYQLRAELESEDEIGRLVETFNEMLATIEKQNNDILEANENLERTVDIRTSELKTANRELEAFSYSVSHDLRQPLRAIDGFSEAIMEDCGDSLDELGMGYLKRVRAASQRMGKLIDSMLVLSRVTRRVIEVSEVNLSVIAEKILKHLSEDNPEHKALWEIEPDIKVTGDESLLNIALTNLIGNAWKYSSKNELIKIWVGTEKTNNETIIFIKDNGVGFDMKYASKLFVAFNRLHSPEEFEGTGVGLATVYRVINRHHGRLWAESKLGDGSTFYFTINH